jgi:hypothetical protein
MEQYSFKYLLNILSQNIQALTYTQITLLDLLDKDGYKRFINCYNEFIAKMIERGYTKDFEESVANELNGIWSAIYGICQHIIAEAMDLIYDDTSEILKTLCGTLTREMTPKEAENCSFSLRFLSKPECCKKMLS